MIHYDLDTMRYHPSREISKILGVHTDSLFVMYFGRSAPLIFSGSCGMGVNLTFHKKKCSFIKFRLVEIEMVYKSCLR